ncbi:MAG: 50S ribosomal protein L11 methyltransferase [Pyrinomonadaceae bacterium]|nr:50S ribosomal protein L11 methyltransferase [Pyrinomonadaceae bacterium]
MKKKERDEKFAAHMPGVLQYHRLMLGDAVRNRLLAKAIKQVVNEETSFLDIGAGSGIWAILAAKLGAKRVVAVEIEEALIPFIYKHAQENGVANKIEIIHGRSDDVKIKGKFDVIVSELFGGDAMGAETIKSFIDLRTRFLAADGVLMPHRLISFAAPVHLRSDDVPATLDLGTDFLRSVQLNYPINLTAVEKNRAQYLGEPVPLVDIDFRNIDTPPPLANLTASWKLEDLSKVNAIATFNRHYFTEKIQMDSRKSQSWGVGIYPFEPFAVKKGELSLSLTIDAKQGNWTVAVPSNPEIRPQSYSPVFAFTRVRMSQQMTPHRKFKSPTTKK